MLLTNQRLDKLNAVRVDYISRGMLPSEHQTPIVDDEDDDIGPTDERVLADVKLARKKGASSFVSTIILYISDLISRTDVSLSIVVTRHLH
jgi:hypothetical protein